MKDELAKLYEMIEDMEIAMMTTRRSDGHMVSRPMATQKHTPGANPWFMTLEDMCMWLPQEGDSRHGTPEDPRIVLIGIDIHSATFFEVDKPQPVVLFEMVKGWITGEEPKLGKEHRI